MTRPQLLLVPVLTELEWAIKPQLEAWAEVASFDAPGVGNEPRPEKFEREAIVRRALVELDRRGWDSCFVVSDSWGGVTAVRVAAACPGEVQGLALGHARLSNRTEGERAPVNKAVWDAMGQLLSNDYGAFVRYGLTQLTQGSVGDKLAEQMLERVPMEVAQAAFDSAITESESIEGLLRGLDAPMLFAKHEGCLGSTEEGWEDAVAAFPDAVKVSVPDAPSVSAEFAEALRTFCGRVAAVPVPT